MKNRLSWAAILAVIVVLGGYAAYLAFLRDWRSSFTPEQLDLEVTSAGPDLEVTLRNRSGAPIIICESPLLASPYVVSLAPEGGGAPLKPARAPSGQPAGYSLILDAGKERSWRVPWGSLYPGLGPGGYWLSVAYDPAGAAERGEKCAQELTLGRVEARPVLVRIAARRLPAGGRYFAAAS